MRFEVDKSTLQKLYWRKMLPLQEMAEILGVSRSTVSRRMEEKNVPRRSISEAREAFNEKKMDLSPSSELSYVVGTSKGDGSVFKTSAGQYVVKMEVCDEEFAEEFARCLKKVLGKDVCRGKRKRRSPNHQPTFIVLTYSKPLFSFLSQSLVELREKVEKYPIGFIRGFYDSEGNLKWKYGHGGGYVIRVSNTDLGLLKFVKYLVEKYVGVKTSINRCGRHNARSLAITNKKEVKNFCDKVKPTIRRLNYEFRGS